MKIYVVIVRNGRAMQLELAFNSEDVANIYAGKMRKIYEGAEVIVLETTLALVR